MDVEAQLRIGLNEKAVTMHAPVDPYASFLRREEQNRRSRRIRTGVVALVVAGVVGVSGAVGLNLADRSERSSPSDGMHGQENWVPVPEPTGSDSPEDIAAATEALLDSPVRGSLAGDQEWLERMRTYVAGEAAARLRENVVRPVEEKDVQFLYAGEIGNTRQVAAYVPATTKGGNDASRVYWFQGEAGEDRVKQMMYGTSADPIGDATAAFRWEYSANDEDGYLLALGPVGSTVTAGTELTFRADGTATRTIESGQEGSGLLELVVPPQPGGRADIAVTITRDGETRNITSGTLTSGMGGLDGRVFQDVVDEAMGERTAEQVWGERGPTDLPPTANWLRESLTEANLSLDSAGLEIPWAGLIDGEPALVFTVQAPGEGVLAFAWRGTLGSLDRNDYRVLMPAQGAAQRPIAYRLATLEGEQTNGINVIAPPGTVRLELKADGQDAQSLDLDESRRAEAELDPQQAATVTAYDEAGDEIGSAPVLPFAGKGSVGEAEGTRLVP
ncbi:hypothetical protein [Kineosporia babensis]|uniref:Uncharacterized protein n=1 Tax=Kineosporia babensis TaxID=499548 RepID=A0A9X1NFX3_9ACTN|nr:hypothetical protein [Kineosporia babensis]MCD5314372.1 hypothetical protein [Kineosporia babensis]